MIKKMDKEFIIFLKMKKRSLSKNCKKIIMIQIKLLKRIIRLYKRIKKYPKLINSNKEKII
jgi:hypothetical protein